MIVSPVLGLRPSRCVRSATSKVPKPTSVTLSAGSQSVRHRRNKTVQRFFRYSLGNTGVIRNFPHQVGFRHLFLLRKFVPATQPLKTKV